LIYSSSFSLVITVPVTGMSYKIHQVLLTDRSGNQFVITLDTVYYS